MRDKFADPWVKHLNQHLVRQNAEDTRVRFSGKVKTSQLLSFWDNGELKIVGSDKWIFKRISDNESRPVIAKILLGYRTI